MQVGTQIPADILIKGMIVQSGNDATIALAERVGGTEAAFAQMMNEYAKRLGMKGSNFENSDGLPSPNHYTTARDVATLAGGADPRVPAVLPAVQPQEFMWNNIHQENRNGLLSKDPTVDGLKTGHTDSAGYCLATSANRNGMRLISVVMGSPSDQGARGRQRRAAQLRLHLLRDRARQGGARDGSSSRASTSPRASSPSSACPYDVYATIGRGQGGSLKTAAHLNGEPLIAPLAAGKPVGEFTVTDASGAVIARAPLVPFAAVPLGGLWTRTVDSIALWFH